MSAAFSMESRNLLLTSIAGWTYAVGTLGKRRAKILVNAAIAESYKKECQEKNLPSGSMPVDFLSRHSAQLFERALLL
jgi:hypothetical protein